MFNYIVLRCNSIKYIKIIIYVRGSYYSYNSTATLLLLLYSYIYLLQQGIVGMCRQVYWSIESFPNRWERTFHFGEMRKN